MYFCLTLCKYLCRGSALERRLRDRQKEKEADARDRAKEKEELEEIKRKLFEEGHPDPETEIARVMQYCSKLLSLFNA